jgi:hypothetical protein
MKQRDMSKAEFSAKLKQYGFTAQGFMGYYRLPNKYRSWCVSVLNGGPTRREQLAYLLRMLKRAKALP